MKLTVGEVVGILTVFSVYHSLLLRWFWRVLKMLRKDISNEIQAVNNQLQAMKDHMEEKIDRTEKDFKLVCDQRTKASEDRFKVLEDMVWGHDHKQGRVIIRMEKGGSR